MGTKEKEGAKPVEISLVYRGDEHRVYANYFSVSHTPFEFTFDFAIVPPELITKFVTGAQSKPIEISPSIRVVLPPALIPAVITALQENLKKYESNIGPAKLPGIAVGQKG